jgi:hypothetical protein
MELGNLDLALLAAFKVSQIRGGGLNFYAEYHGEEQAAAAEEFCIRLADLARMPGVGVFTHDTAKAHTEAEEQETARPELPEVGLHVLPLDPEPDFEKLRYQVKTLRGSCLFALDSGDENALA